MPDYQSSKTYYCRYSSIKTAFVRLSFRHRKRSVNSDLGL